MTQLTSQRVVYEPLEDIEYFIQLALKEAKFVHSREEIEELILRDGMEFWKVIIDGQPAGVCGYFLSNGICVLEALKDPAAHRLGFSYSVEVGQTVLAYLFSFTTKVRTFARQDGKAVQLLCKKLGFQEICRVQEFVIYEKVRA